MPLLDVAEEGGVDGNAHRYLRVLLHDVRAYLEVDAGDRGFFRYGGVALNELLFADGGAGFGRDEGVHLAVLLPLPEVKVALRGLLGRLGRLRLRFGSGLSARV